jgi:2-hydroxychromene-2-carboxylate isomerase
MSKTVDFIFDFGSPNAYLAWQVLPALCARTGTKVNVIPCLLGGLFKLTGNQAPMTAFGGVIGKLEYERLETQRFIAKHGLKAFRFNPYFPVNTLMIMRGLIVARRRDVGDQFLEAVLRAMWEEGQKMDDPAVVAAVLSAAGLDAKVILQACQDQEVKTELAANTAAAVERGVFGVPTFFVGKEMFFGKERLGQIEEELNKFADS